MKLNKIDSIIVYTKHLPIREQQRILKERFDIERSTGFIHNRRAAIKEIAQNILFEEAKTFPDKHLTRLTTLQYLIDGSFEDLEKESDPLKRQHIRDSIVAMQYDLAAFDEATKGVIEKEQIQAPKKEEEVIQ